MSHNEAEMVAAHLTHDEYLTLRNTVRVLRGSGVELTADEKEKVDKYQAAVILYERNRAVQS